MTESHNLRVLQRTTTRVDDCFRVRYIRSYVEGQRMAYFSRGDDGVERRGKVAADIACALVLASFSVAFFGFFGGGIAFIVLEAALIGVDRLMPNAEESSGTAIR